VFDGAKKSIFLKSIFVLATAMIVASLKKVISLICSYIEVPCCYISYIPGIAKAFLLRFFSSWRGEFGEFEKLEFLAVVDI
jgi:hypothetical protein